MNPDPVSRNTTESLNLESLFQRKGENGRQPLLASELFSRSLEETTGHTRILIDEFPGEEETPSCAFLRLLPGEARPVRFSATGNFELLASPSGGWLLVANDDTACSYWIPQPPTLRTTDSNDRILSEEMASVTGMQASPDRFSTVLEVPRGTHLDWIVWRLPPGPAGVVEELRQPLALERQPTFTWSSQANCSSPADVYRYLVHGLFYENAYAWPRKWKFSCELDAFELYVRLNSLETATGKQIYGLLKKQVLYSVIYRQSEDGGWYHGEWTDLKECHYRFHCGALLMLENALDEWPGEPLITESLRKGAAFVASRTDETDLGTWFLHDSLEEKPELMDEIPKMFSRALPNQKGRGAWKPSTFLGKSPTNKMILNTHVDTTIALDRYREATGDGQYDELVTSARNAAQKLLMRRPAEPLYKLVYGLVGLTLLPVSQAQSLPLPVRAAKRLTWKYLTPRLYHLKWKYPRIVMPGGFIDRHLSPLHFDAKYHAVNVMDLVRLWRRFPEQDLGEVIEGGIRFVMGKDRSILRWWSEDKPRNFAIAVFGEALYHLCMLKDDQNYRSLLAQVLLAIDEIGLGMPPSLWGGNAEIVPRHLQVPCPIPDNPRLRIANLSRADDRELLVVNPAREEQELRWEREPDFTPSWITPKGEALQQAGGRILVPPGGWLLGRG